MTQNKILVVDDDTQMQLAIKTSLMRNGYEATVAANGKQALKFLDNETFDVIISDQRMPEMDGLELLATLQERESDIPFVMITAYGTITQAVEAMQAGASDFITKPFSVEDLLRVIERVTSPECRQLQKSSKKHSRGRPIITNDPLMIRILEVAEAVAKSDATVLVQGESGTGKELIARLIHSASARSSQPFVAVNCAALPANLLESELFGHEKGAFTGAQTRKIGKFELAQGGTILLDEISEMDLALQAKLLRVLQEREVDRVGGREPIQIDVRVVATTTKNLESAVQEGKFRADLYYRLNVIPITLPPLRERKGDIKLLVDFFIKKFLGDQAPKVDDNVLATLTSYSWPGNIRELQNAVERAAILSKGRAPQEKDFLLTQTGRASIQEISPKQEYVSLASRIEKEVIREPELEETKELEITKTSDNKLVIGSGMTVQEVEKALIFETLRATNDNRTQAAKLLGISIRTLRNKLNEYKVE